MPIQELLLICKFMGLSRNFRNDTHKGALKRIIIRLLIDMIDLKRNYLLGSILHSKVRKYNREIALRFSSDSSKKNRRGKRPMSLS